MLVHEALEHHRPGDPGLQLLPGPLDPGIELRPGDLPQPPVHDRREPARDHVPPLLDAQPEPGDEALCLGRGQVLMHRLPVHAQRHGELALRAASIPVHEQFDQIHRCHTPTRQTTNPAPGPTIGPEARLSDRSPAVRDVVPMGNNVANHRSTWGNPWREPTYRWGITWRTTVATLIRISFSASYLPHC